MPAPLSSTSDDPLRPAPPRLRSPLVLLDGASMWFRSYFGVPSSITAPDGRPVNAVRGFIDSMAVVITQQRPSRLVVCLDLDWRPQFRVDLIPSYKAHRVAHEIGGPAGWNLALGHPPWSFRPDFVSALGLKS